MQSMAIRSRREYVSYSCVGVWIFQIIEFSAHVGKLIYLGDIICIIDTENYLKEWKMFSLYCNIELHAWFYNGWRFQPVEKRTLGLFYWNVSKSCDNTVNLSMLKKMDRNFKVIFKKQNLSFSWLLIENLLLWDWLVFTAFPFRCTHWNFGLGRHIFHLIQINVYFISCILFYMDQRFVFLTELLFVTIDLCHLLELIEMARFKYKLWYK